MRSKKIIFISSIVTLGIVFGLWSWYGSNDTVYKNESWGIVFQYPQNYILEERGAPTTERDMHHIVLTKEKTPPMGEGPTAITVDLFDNSMEKLTLENWIKNTSVSNFKLSDGKLRAVSVSGISGYTYRWDGLYQGVSIVITKGQTVAMLSVTYMDPTDSIVKDFEGVIDTFHFTK